MPIIKQLDDLRNTIPLCSAVGLVDVSSGIVLCVSIAKKRPQEQMDALCASAAQLFHSPTSTAVSGLFGKDASDTIQDAIVSNADETCLFLRSPVDSMEAMFCQCAPHVDIETAMDNARATLNRIATE